MLMLLIEERCSSTGEDGLIYMTTNEAFFSRYSSTCPCLDSLCL
jgi:hypothetical protein